ncbi:cytochrome b/b6 domain-containing protein [Devosia sp.]|uniref:cytochrome b n=1 Tax=Devosia sp. TaxID=1871048 RepID=UPI001B2E56CE|nr:cytochrome b/b6 domain-containing protein [Devosia sp.]MBO9590194.1 cytochrome b/b6 domain-containing protein [Devosia sp.]
MSVSTPSAGYSRAQVILHWVIAALILFQLLVHESMEMAWDARMEGGPAEGANPLPHIIVGSLILILAAARVVIRLRHGAPPHPAGQPAALGVVANVIHGLIYVLLFALPISGLVAWFGGIENAADVHGGPLRLALIALVLIHIAGALVQQFVLRSGVLMRMLKPES